PEMDGCQATAAIREMEKGDVPRIPIVAMTAHAMKGDKERCLQAGMDGYISKPVQSKILYETIEAITASRLQLVAATPESQSAEAALLSARIVNLNEMLERIDGNLGLLQSIISIFEEDHPAQLLKIREAIETKDATTLTSTAHTLKGSLLALAADRAAAVALELEKLG